MTKPKFYITTAIAYANAKPHIGFALELVLADAIARYKRLTGHEVFFLTGTDEHGTKIYTTAKEANMSPQDFVDSMSRHFQELIDKLQISNTDFIRTTDRQRHYPTAQKVWEQLVASGDIYMGHYKGYYCVNDEDYITATEYASGAYANKTVIELEEDNYLLKTSNYQSALTAALGSELKIIPAHREVEIANFIGTGLTDTSVSRQADKMPWGIPVPSDPKHVMYVWCDALTNYISSLGYANNSPLFTKFWPADVQVIGKDILRFHAIIWPAILFGLKLPLPRHLLVHGFITHNGQKMSKSIGNVVDPLEPIATYGSDAFRFYLLSEIPTFDDGDYSDDRMKSTYISLANELGNLVNRVISMAIKYSDGVVPASPNSQDLPCIEQVAKAMEAYDVKAAIESIVADVRATNVAIDMAKPWALAKEDLPATQLLLGDWLQRLHQVAIMLYPFMPELSGRLRAQLGLAPLDPTVIDLESELNAGLPVGTRLDLAGLLFPPLE